MSLVKFHSQLGPTVTVFTGVPGIDEHAFNVHKDLLAVNSRYFNAALSGDWKEARDGVFRLSDVHPRFFAIFVHWLYHRQIDLEPLHEDKSTPEALRAQQFLRVAMADLASRTPKSEFEPSDYLGFWTTSDSDMKQGYLHCILAYTLGDRLQSAPFKNDIIDHLGMGVAVS